MRLTCYHTIFSTLKQQTDPTIPIDSVINSVPVPQAVFTSSEQEMPVVVANMMYEGYADRLLTDSILLMLYETEVDHAEQDVIHYLVELAKQSIQNIGRYLSTTKIHFQTHSDYCLNQYELQPQYLSLMMNRISLFHRSKLRSEKRDYSALGPSQPSPKDLPYFHVWICFGFHVVKYNCPDYTIFDSKTNKSSVASQVYLRTNGFLSAITQNRVANDFIVFVYWETD